MKLSDIPKWLPKLQELAEGMKAGRRIQYNPAEKHWVTLVGKTAEILPNHESPDQYRVEPEPVKPREVWGLKHIESDSISSISFISFERAEAYMKEMNIDGDYKPVKFVEVVDE